MCTDFIKDTGLLLAPLPRYPDEIVIVHLAVQLVRIHRINTILKFVVVGLKPANRLIPLLSYVGMACPQRLAYLLKDPAIDSQPTEYFNELLLYDLLAHVFAPARRYFATARIAAAVVVGVFLFLTLAHNGATAFGTSDKLRACESPCRALRFGGIARR